MSEESEGAAIAREILASGGIAINPGEPVQINPGDIGPALTVDDMRDFLDKVFRIDSSTLTDTNVTDIMATGFVAVCAELYALYVLIKNDPSVLMTTVLMGHFSEEHKSLVTQHFFESITHGIGSEHYAVAARERTSQEGTMAVGDWTIGNEV